LSRRREERKQRMKEEILCWLPCIRVCIVVSGRSRTTSAQVLLPDFCFLFRPFCYSSLPVLHSSEEFFPRSRSTPETFGFPRAGNIRESSLETRSGSAGLVFLKPSRDRFKNAIRSREPLVCSFNETKLE
jgi:hypothetical protein